MFIRSEVFPLCCITKQLSSSKWIHFGFEAWVNLYNSSSSFCVHSYSSQDANVDQGVHLFFSFSTNIQGISEKCTGAFKFVCRIIFWSIYLSKVCCKSGLISIAIYRIHKKIFILCFNFITNIEYVNIYFKIFLSNLYKYHFECT